MSMLNARATLAADAVFRNRLKMAIVNEANYHLDQNTYNAGTANQRLCLECANAGVSAHVESFALQAANDATIANAAISENGGVYTVSQSSVSDAQISQVVGSKWSRVAGPNS
jgi:hypothetical protein